jgi:6,7-dimethyl-8-ribityllumazine synthase
MSTHGKIAPARFAFIKARWHADIVDRSLEGFTQLIPTDQIDVFDVPGAFEMPLWHRNWHPPANIRP